jgi:hypothetical protein
MVLFPPGMTPAQDTGQKICNGTKDILTPIDGWWIIYCHDFDHSS